MRPVEAVMEDWGAEGSILGLWGLCGLPSAKAGQKLGMNPPRIAARARVSKAQRSALEWLGARRGWWVADNPEQSDLMSLLEAWPDLVERKALRRADSAGHKFAWRASRLATRRSTVCIDGSRAF